MISFVVVFGATLIVGGIVQWAIAKLVESTGLSGTDRILGFVFGGARGAIVCIVALIALRPFAIDAHWWQASRLQRELLAFEGDVLQLDDARPAISHTVARAVPISCRTSPSNTAAVRTFWRA